MPPVPPADTQFGGETEVSAIRLEGVTVVS